MQGGKAGRRACVDVGTAFEQDAGHLEIVRGRRPHQRGLTANRFHGVDVRAGGHQPLDSGDLARARRDHQRGFSGGRGAVGVRAGAKEPVDDFHVADLAGDQERADAVPVRRHGVGTAAEQHAHDLDLVALDSPVQRCRPIEIARIDVGVLLNEPAYLGGVALPDRADERVLASAHRGARAREHEHHCEPAQKIQAHELHTRQRFEIHSAGTVAKFLDRHTDLLEQRHVEIVHRRVLREPQMTSTLQLPGATAHDHER